MGAALPRRVLVAGTADTKGHELAYLAGCVRACGLNAETIDVGTQGTPTPPTDIRRETVLGTTNSLEGARAQRIARMGQALGRFLLTEHAAGRVQGVLGLGGSGGTDRKSVV